MDWKKEKEGPEEEEEEEGYEEEGGGLIPPQPEFEKRCSLPLQKSTQSVANTGLTLEVDMR